MKGSFSVLLKLGKRIYLRHCPLERSAGVGGSRQRAPLVVVSLKRTMTKLKEEKGRELVAPGLPVSRGRGRPWRTRLEDVAHAAGAGIAALVSFPSPLSVIGTDIVLLGR